MTTFTVGKPVTTAVAEVTVDAGLPLGSHRFQLVVVDADGNSSKAAEVVVQVDRVIAAPTDPTPTRPTPSNPTLTPTRMAPRTATSRRNPT